MVVNTPSVDSLDAVIGTQLVATLICVAGFLAAPLWWGWAMVWGYALDWFLVTDPLKLFAYRSLDPTSVRKDSTTESVTIRLYPHAPPAPRLGNMAPSAKSR